MNNATSYNIEDVSPSQSYKRFMTQTKSGLHISMHIMDGALVSDIGQVYFETEHVIEGLPNNTTAPIRTTAREFTKYKQMFGEVVHYDAKKVVVEFGCGLSDYLPEFAKRVQNPNQVIAIDRFDYNAAEALLNFAGSKEYQSPLVRYELKRITSNLQILTNPNLVTLINMDLHDAVRFRPELKGVGDIGIDLAGVFGYLGVAIPNAKYIQNQGRNLQRALFTQTHEHARFFLKEDAPLLYSNKLRGE
jgi:hypothetical protein